MLSILEREERWGICILGVVKYIGITELILDLSYRGVAEVLWIWGHDFGILVYRSQIVHAVCMTAA